MKILSKLKNLFIKLIHINPKKAVIDFIKNTKAGLLFLRYIIGEFFAFYVLITLYVIDSILVKRLIKTRLLPHFIIAGLLKSFSTMYSYIQHRLDRVDRDSISKLDLIQLSIRNMKVKKTRTLITIGGVSIGIAAIVFLVSLGYGLQKLVISRVARLDELKQADISTQPGSKIRIDDKTLADVSTFPEVDGVYPLIAVVGRVNYQNSISDMAAYGVTSDYLDRSAIKPVQGKIFESHDIAFTPRKSAEALESGEVAGAMTERKFGEHGEKISNIEFSINPGEWIRVRKGPSTTDEIIGYTKRMEGTMYGEGYFGESYGDDEFGSFAQTADGSPLGAWVKTKIYLWDEQPCNVQTDVDCTDGEYIAQRDDSESHVYDYGYFAAINVDVKNLNMNNHTGQVLGDSTSTITAGDVLASETVETGQTTTSANPLDSIKIEEGSDWVEIPDENAATIEEVSKVTISDQALRESVVNRAMIKLLGITEEEAIGKTYNVSFVIPADLLENSDKRVESESAEYVITGVTPDDSSPVFYVPFVDLRSLGIVNFTQFKVSVKNPDALDKVRKQIESIGYVTQSVVDTVTQINSLFETLRFVLAIMGMVALSVASLGMFNTLTVSLLERSREVGLMKAMGMKTSEVQELFLTESIIMGFCAGLAGLLLGFIGGKLLGVILTMFAIFKGQGFIDVTYIPFSFVVIIMTLSLLVGMLTGLYPAKRSKKISALNALRYE